MTVSLLAGSWGTACLWQNWMKRRALELYVALVEPAEALRMSSCSCAVKGWLGPQGWEWAHDRPMGRGKRSG